MTTSELAPIIVRSRRSYVPARWSCADAGRRQPGGQRPSSKRRRTYDPTRQTRIDAALPIDRRNPMKMAGAGAVALGVMSLGEPGDGLGAGSVAWRRQFLRQRPRDRAADHLQDPVSDDGRRQPLHPERSRPLGRHAGDRRRPPDGRREGAERQPLRDQDGRAGLRHPVARPALSGATARASRATPSRRTSTPRPSAPRSTILGTQDFVDRDRIGAIGICGSGSFVISAAKIDPRMRADRDGQHVRHGRGEPQRAAAIR